MYRESRSLAVLPPAQRFSGAHAQVVALFADIRGFSTWSESQDLDTVAELVETQFERVVQIGHAHQHHFHKFLGDGFVVLWEAGRGRDAGQCLVEALASARQLHEDYHALTARCSGTMPPGYGIAIAVGEAIRLQPNAHLTGLAEADFVGYPMNCAARLQALAEAEGTVVCATSAALLSPRPGMGAWRAAAELVVPDAAAVQRAGLMKGLKPEDRTGFRYVRFATPGPAAALR